MASAQVHTVRAVYEALERGDRDALLALVHPEVMAYQPDSLPYAGYYRGVEGLLELRARVEQTWQGYREELQRLIECGDEVVAMLYTLGRARATGKPFMMLVAEFWQVRGGRAVEVRSFYWDTAALAEALRPES